jgi:hypothetical protein
VIAKLLALYEHLSCRRPYKAQKHTHGGALSGAILAEKPVDFSLPDGERKLLYRVKVFEALGKIMGADDWFQKRS